MNSDPLLTGVGTLFPNQNSSSAPTIWEEDMPQAAQQGTPCGSGPMLFLTKRSSNQQFLPGGALNPCPEPAPLCVRVDNMRAGVTPPLSRALIAANVVGGAFMGGTPGNAGIGVIGLGTPGDGVRGLSMGPEPTGHGVFGFTSSPNTARAGVTGTASTPQARGLLGIHAGFPPGSGLTFVTQAVRGEGGTIGLCGEGKTVEPNGTPARTSWGVVGRGAATGVDGRGVGAGTFGVVGVGGVAGVWGGDSTSGGIGVIGVSGPNFSSGGLTFTPWAGRFDGPVLVRGNLSITGSLFVSGPTKSSVVPHPDGSQRVMHTVEAPESWFEDIGRAQLRQGVARVEVDPDFAAVSGLDYDYHVFLTPEGESNGLYVTNRTSTGFEVREQGEGTSEISFSYRIMTKRTDIRTGRLEPIDLPSEAGEAAAAEPAERPVVPSPLSPGEPEGPPPEGGVPERPLDWPETVPWPPDVMTLR